MADYPSVSPREDPHQRLRFLCNIDEATRSAKPDDAFDEISDLLSQIGKREWSLRPRTYVILYNMDSVKVMDAFATYGLDDSAIPYRNKVDLPSELQSLYISHRFLELQQYVLTEACNLEDDREPRHVSLTDGNVHFYVQRSLGFGLSG